MLHIGKIELNHDGEAKLEEIDRLFGALIRNLSAICDKDSFSLITDTLSDAAVLAHESMASLPENQKDPSAVAAGNDEGKSICGETGSDEQR